MIEKEKKPNVIKSPDIKQMQVVVIDHRTRIYIPVGQDPAKARVRYLALFNTLKKL